MPNLDDICWAAVTFRDQAIVLNIWRGNFAYSDILGNIDFLETLRYSPQDLEVNQVRSLLVLFLNKWGCRLRDDNVTASNLKSCIVDVHPELLTVQNHSILNFDFELPENIERIENIFNRFCFYERRVARNFGPTYK